MFKGYQQLEQVLPYSEIELLNKKGWHKSASFW